MSESENYSQDFNFNDFINNDELLRASVLGSSGSDNASESEDNGNEDLSTAEDFNNFMHEMENHYDFTEKRGDTIPIEEPDTDELDSQFTEDFDFDTSSVIENEDDDEFLKFLASNDNVIDNKSEDNAQISNGIPADFDLPDVGMSDDDMLEGFPDDMPDDMPTDIPSFPAEQEDSQESPEDYGLFSFDEFEAANDMSHSNSAEPSVSEELKPDDVKKSDEPDFKESYESKDTSSDKPRPRFQIIRDDPADEAEQKPLNKAEMKNEPSKKEFLFDENRMKSGIAAMRRKREAEKLEAIQKRRQRASERNSSARDSKRSSNIPQPKFELEQAKKFKSDLRAEFDKQTAFKTIEGITLAVDKYTYNKEDETETIRERLGIQTQESPKNELNLNKAKVEIDKTPIISDSDTSDTSNQDVFSDINDVKTDTKSEDKNVSESSPENTESEPVTPADESKDDDPNAHIKDKDTSDGSALLDNKKKKEIKEVRKYHGKKAPVEKVIYKKAKEQTRAGVAYIGAALAAAGVGIFVGVKSNSYYNYVNGKKADVLTCIKNGFLQSDIPVSLFPFNARTFFMSFLLVFAVIFLIAVYNIYEKSQREKRREGHEHGKARFGEPKDFKQYKKDFMDMS